VGCDAIWCQNGSPTYQRAITKVFHEYIDVFVQIFLDDFTVFNDLSTHLEKFRKSFFKFRKIGISLNPSKLLMGWHNFIGVLSKTLLLLCHQSPTAKEV
jgi:hypothetical protein